MPRFHFNVYDGETSIDEAGTELPDLVFARREAIRYSGELLEDAGRREGLGPEWRMEVTDESGLILFALHFVVIEAPAISKKPEE
ncbi:hypothetical protein IHQ68_03365 [Chelatococcus sambhunathii]|uniref:DUF6894 domain-containing protein n=1 Tax=Chelatococcus sambhunathii TaxID=363953 RepID=A0ABU1DC63_9HYPH|nr:hypothetical protein [Chelatococcus sambhunathii]MDR4305661.1 hypothetical protein [Chelatococcus sambhunathii]